MLNKEQEYSLYVYPEPRFISDQNFSIGGTGSGQPGYRPASAYQVLVENTVVPISNQPPQPYDPQHPDDLTFGATILWWDVNSNQWIQSFWSNEPEYTDLIGQGEFEEIAQTNYRLAQILNRQSNMFEPISPKDWQSTALKGDNILMLPTQKDIDQNVLQPACWGCDIILRSPLRNEALYNWGGRLDTFHFGFVQQVFVNNARGETFTSLSYPKEIMNIENRFDLMNWG